MNQFTSAVVAIYRSNNYYYIQINTSTANAYIGVKERTAKALADRLNLKLGKGNDKDYGNAIY